MRRRRRVIRRLVPVRCFLKICISSGCGSPQGGLGQRLALILELAGNASRQEAFRPRTRKSKQKIYQQNRPGIRQTNSHIRSGRSCGRHLSARSHTHSSTHHLVRTGTHSLGHTFHARPLSRTLPHSQNCSWQTCCGHEMQRSRLRARILFKPNANR